jgi:hypothetical protein
MEHEQAARLWVAALAAPTEDNTSALDEVLSEDVASVSPMGAAQGKSDVVASVGQSPLASFFTQATWGEPAIDGETVEMTATFPPQAPVGGATIRFVFDGGRINRIETSLLPAAAPTPTKIEITDEMGAAVNGALANRNPIMVAYVDREGQPHLSFRGTTQVFSNDQLAIWIRSPEGGLVSAIELNPHLAIFYRDPATRTMYQFHGRAHADRSAETAEVVYGNSPEAERNMDLQRRGVAIVIDLDRVEGRDPSGPILMTRDSTG